MSEELFKSIPDFMLDEPANLTWRGIKELIEIIWERDNLAFKRISALETEVFGPA